MRPLIGINAAALRAFCAEHGLAPVDDPSNHDLTQRRNLLRALLARPAASAPSGRPSLEADMLRLAEACDVAKQVYWRQVSASYPTLSHPNAFCALQ